MCVDGSDDFTSLLLNWLREPFNVNQWIDKNEFLS
jgi:hypothetical protein